MVKIKNLFVLFRIMDKNVNKIFCPSRASLIPNIERN